MYRIPVFHAVARHVIDCATKIIVSQKYVYVGFILMRGFISAALSRVSGGTGQKTEMGRGM